MKQISFFLLILLVFTPQVFVFAEDTAAELIAKMRDPDERIRRDAALRLLGLGAEAKPVKNDLETLKNTSSDPCIKAMAKKILGAFEVDVASLTQKLANPNDKVRQDAVNGLSKAGPFAKAAVKELTAALQDRNANIRATAARTLGAIGPDAKQDVPALVAALKDSNETVSLEALQALGAIGGDSDQAKAALLELLKGTDEKKKEAAAKAIGCMGGKGAELAPALLAALDDKIAHGEALYALSLLGEEAVPKIVEAMKDSRRQRRNDCLSALGLAAWKSKKALTALLETMKSPDPEIRMQAAFAAQYIRTQDAVSGLATLLGDSNKAVCEEALSTFCLYREMDLTEAIQPTIKLLSSDDPKIRSKASNLLWNVGAPAMPSLIPLIKTADAKLRLSAMETMHGPAAKDALPDLIQALKDTEPGIRIVAGRAIASIGPSGKEALPSLLALTKDKDASVRGNAFIDLATLDPDSKTTRNAIAAGLKDDDPDVKKSAADAFKLAKDGTGKNMPETFSSVLWEHKPAPQPILDQDKAKELLQKKMNFEFVEIPLAVVIEFFQRNMRLKISAPPEALKEHTPKYSVTIKVCDMDLACALKWIFELCGMEYRLQDGVIIAVWKKLQAKPANKAFARKAEDWEPSIYNSFQAKPMADFKDMPFDQVIMFWRETANKTIVIMPDAYKLANKTVTLNSRNMDFEKAFEQVLDMEGLDYDIRDQAVVIEKKGQTANPRHFSDIKK